MKSIRVTVVVILVLIGLMVWIERAEYFSFLDGEEPLGVSMSESVEQGGS